MVPMMPMVPMVLVAPGEAVRHVCQQQREQYSTDRRNEDRADYRGEVQHER
jgi:hypothetical protein